ncbi:hypothetical protein DPMN_086956 [Dreissena polymorpha]|uniref:ATP-dependent DNA helicase n=1 Tax=Dreissena polymorpha TaxID=45954 RepID=A0A9D4QWG0_DREPO|nr:hypothetical protein DPMN_086956 [Dreissena polymorpha]
MKEEQVLALDVGVHGHNLSFLGPAGTGKSYVVSEIYKAQLEKGIKSQITCATGIACSVYPGEKNGSPIADKG